MPQAHIPVLLDEALALLNPQPGQAAVDCTAGLGGHAAAVAQRLGPTGTLVLFDLDPGNLAVAEARIRALPSPPRVIVIHANFAEAPRRLAEQGLSADLVLADLGFASGQVDDPSRGFSFSRDGPLDMRLNPAGPVTAAGLVAGLSERELAEIIREFGEERHAARIAQKLVQERRIEPIQTTARLAAIVRSAAGFSRKGTPQSIDPATRTFQALRIAVNDELANLRSLLDAVERTARANAGNQSPPTWLSPEARVAIIAFHSLEDRPIKQTFARLTDQGLAAALTRKPVLATDDEVARNPRARSAKLRAVRLVGRA